jgi:anaerobic selenocysteine-containing dehydrogenase
MNRRPEEPPKIPRFSGFSPPLMVVGFIATRSGDAERGPMIRMRPDDALVRLVTDQELVRVVTERRQEIAELQLDETLARGTVVLRDVAGASISEIVRVIRLDMDGPRNA